VNAKERPPPGRSTLTATHTSNGRGDDGALVPGTYAVTVTVHGRGPKSKPVELTDIVVGPGERIRREVKLEDAATPAP